MRASCYTDVRYSCCDLFTTFPIVAHQFARTKGHGYGRGSGPPRPRMGRGLVTSARLDQLIHHTQPAHTVVFLQPLPPSCRPSTLSFLPVSYSLLTSPLSISVSFPLLFGDVGVVLQSFQLYTHSSSLTG